MIVLKYVYEKYLIVEIDYTFICPVKSWLNQF